MVVVVVVVVVQGGSNMTGTNCDLFTHNQSRSYLNHLVVVVVVVVVVISGILRSDSSDHITRENNVVFIGCANAGYCRLYQNCS